MQPPAGEKSGKWMDVELSGGKLENDQHSDYGLGGDEIHSGNFKPCFSQVN